MFLLYFQTYISFCLQQGVPGLMGQSGILGPIGRVVSDSMPRFKHFIFPMSLRTMKRIYDDKVYRSVARRRVNNWVSNCYAVRREQLSKFRKNSVVRVLFEASIILIIFTSNIFLFRVPEVLLVIQATEAPRVKW